VKITFLLPLSAHAPIGGFKVVFEYANELVKLGHEVCIVDATFVRTDKDISKARLLRHRANFVVRAITGSWRPKSWFQLNPRVEMIWIPELAEKRVPDADAIFATSWSTAERAVSFGGAKGRKFYFIQHYETWDGPEDRVRATWRMPFEKIVISKWLQQIAFEMNEQCRYIPNGLDFNKFGMDVRPQDRESNSVGMLFHDADWKGSNDGLNALFSLKPDFPDLSVTLFGVPPAPHGLPAWVEYFQTPSQKKLRAIYNDAAIFVSPSWAEGWPLPPAEAMSCGCALVCTDIGGHREYAVQGQTALLSLPKNPAELAKNVRKLLMDPASRIEMAIRGNRFVGRFTWKRAATEMNRILNQVISGP
jgi:glycosyltransferase involved in cell wall biosynthesis